MRFHPEGPEVSNQTLSRLQFLATLRTNLHGELSPARRRACERAAERTGQKTPPSPEDLHSLVKADPYLQLWSSVLRASQDIMWHYIGEEVDKDLPRLVERYKERTCNPVGSVRTDRNLKIPEYLRQADTHRMPGSYFADAGDTDLRAGAIYDIGGAVYQLGIGNTKGRFLNDSRGNTVVSHLRKYYPNLKVNRILDLGCGVGHNTVPLAKAYPNARVVGVEIGAAMVRFAHLRAEGLGVPIDFIQANAEDTGLEEASFDIVVSQILLHETSPEAMERIFKESVRLVRPGGVVLHLEVPIRFSALDPIDRALGSWEHWYNAESNILASASTDFVNKLEELGLKDVIEGYQPVPDSLDSPPQALEKEGRIGRNWYIVSGVRA